MKKPKRLRGPRVAGWYDGPKRDAVIMLRVDSIEKRAFADAAAAERQTLSEWLRTAATWRLRAAHEADEKRRKTAKRR